MSKLVVLFLALSLMVGSIVLLFFTSSLQDGRAEATYEYKYPGTAASGETLTELGPRIKSALKMSFDNPHYMDNGLGPTIGSSDSILQILSLYDKTSDTICYRFINESEDDITVRFELLLYIFGEYKIEIPAKSEVYAVVSNPDKPLIELVMDYQVSTGWTRNYKLDTNLYVPWWLGKDF